MIDNSNAIDETAASPILAIVLVLAITVILTGGIGTFVLDLGESQLEGATSNADLGVRVSESNGEVTILVKSGTADELQVLVDGQVSEDSLIDAKPGDIIQFTSPSSGTRLTLLEIDDSKITVALDTEM
ncbi:type IV pilin [Haloquadratum walsbyi]|jgi:Protein of unknown function (DUF1628).|uniref:Archaeal Type IV pilin N-terminal domain-containing protein n=1 Tax=Haloquadratum walsbyi J07HQW2 TaxID=1238425 RepID=U1MUH0_9EURY|nr:type IV pilin [Haloquadratum walsbyi]ERG93979.1 MAG: protein of unknown function (DUF1628) [Haloquadratum walsbyi J07HQW2]